MDWADLEPILRRHYAPTVPILIRRYDFYRRDQREGESTSDFVAQLRNMGGPCEFPELDQAIRDRLVLGLRDPDARKVHVALSIEDRPCEMEVDSGSFLSMVSWRTIKRLVPTIRRNKLDDQKLILKDYQGNRIPVVGIGHFKVTFKNHTDVLPLTIVDRDRPSLLGLQWFAPLGIEVTGIHRTDTADWEVTLVRDFQEVFDNSLGKYRGPPISFNLNPNVAPIRLKPRRVPFALKPKIDEQLDKLVAQGVLEPIDHARWETPIVTPIKPDGSIRICGDYKATLNHALQQSAYPVPVVQHLLHSLGGGRVFAKLDLAQAYQQLPVDAETAEAQTIVTHRGAFRCNRLQFGVSVAPGVFQSLMERLLQGIKGVVPYFDDVLIAAADREQLEIRLRAVLNKFKNAGLKVKRDKCQLHTKRVEFLGYLLDRHGIHPTGKKLRAIKEAPTPTNKAELQREETAFQRTKDLLTSDAVLIQYSETLPLSVTCDASPFGIGAVLSHTLPDGTEAPIAFFSRTLAKLERNYSQLDKEALAIVAGVKRFHEYLYGRNFSIITDHKPLLGILAGNKATPNILSPRMTRWSEFLAAYSYELSHRPGKAILHADALSRAPLPDVDDDPAPTTTTLQIETMPCPLLTAPDIAHETNKDKRLARVLSWVERGWPEVEGNEYFKPFRNRQTELFSQKGCILWGDRVVIPETLRDRVLALLHEGHPGVVKMKALARSYAWWPGMDKQIENAVYAKNFTGDPLWVPAQITQVTGPRSYRLQTTDGRSWKRHIDQLRQTRSPAYLRNYVTTRRQTKP
ncbi:uncharacterized protein K02A2.6-like [Pseudonaja textilis]|uniref:uncharacterized protein K02A2.6-like n=1 Tax=Pseudonaja textilis TaxID=8673 RepID=UPI000EAA1B09|nr:uncharacterized protein K02A2.6-like [Pseudonaja textilis]